MNSTKSKCRGLDVCSTVPLWPIYMFKFSNRCWTNNAWYGGALSYINHSGSECCTKPSLGQTLSLTGSIPVVDFPGSNSSNSACRLPSIFFRSLWCYRTAENTKLQGLPFYSQVCVFATLFRYTTLMIKWTENWKFGNSRNARWESLCVLHQLQALSLQLQENCALYNISKTSFGNWSARNVAWN